MCAMTDQSFHWYKTIPEPGEWWVYHVMRDGPRYGNKSRFATVGGSILPVYKVHVRPATEPLWVRLYKRKSKAAWGGVF